MHSGRGEEREYARRLPASRFRPGATPPGKFSQGGESRSEDGLWYRCRCLQLRYQRQAVRFYGEVRNDTHAGYPGGDLVGCRPAWSLRSARLNQAGQICRHRCGDGRPARGCQRSRKRAVRDERRQSLQDARSACALRMKETWSGRRLLVIARDRLFPRFLFHDLAVLQYFPRVFVKEILLITGHGKMPAPREHSILQFEDSLGLSPHRVVCRLRVVEIVSHFLQVGLRAPRIVSLRLAFPKNGGLLARLIAPKNPLAGPGVAE